MKQKKGFLLFVTSWIPGCGQMYQGYMKRGMSLMLGCCLLFFLSMSLRLDSLLIFSVPVWLYTFFDSYNLRSLMGQEKAPQDDWLFGLSTLDQKKLTDLCRGRHSLIGWGLVILGFYALFDGVIGRLLGIYCQSTELWWIYDVVMNYLPRLVLTFGIIALGIWFIRGPKQPKTEDIPPFIPPITGEAQCAKSDHTVVDEQEDRHGEM